MYLNGNITLAVPDFSRTLLFYTEKLGFTVRYRNGEQWAEMSAAGLTIGLTKAKEAGVKGNQISIALNVSDIDKSVRELSARGVSFPVGIQSIGVARLAPFSDPDGNNLYLCQVSTPF